MTSKEKLSLLEYRYSKLCRIECDVANSYNVLFKNINNSSALMGHIYNMVYMDCFKSIMDDVFEILKLKDGNDYE